MNKGKYRGLALLFLILSLGGCSSDSVTDVPLTSGTANFSSTPATTASVSAIALLANPSVLSALGTAAITATVTNGAGTNVIDGVLVSFAVTTNGGLGSVSSSATTVSGVATSTFAALSTPGVVTITASAGGVSATVDLTILGVDVGSIEFSSASPNAIGVKGSGQSETSIITFSVKDVNGAAALDGTSVTFTLNGPNGGELLTPLTGSTKSGTVTTTLQSGSVAGPVRVTATTVINSVSISSLSTGVSIGGGVPSLPHMTLARTPGNLAGLSNTNLNSTVSVFIADRFGNYNILTGTSVSFYTEAGAIDASNVTNASGITTALFRTQLPLPLIYSSANPFSSSNPPSMGDPNNALSRVIAVTRGEECFVDNNGNGVYDLGTDTFPSSCDLSEPFVDENDNSSFDSGTEFFLDANNNGSFDGPNGTWDGNLMIWRSTQIAFTAEASQIGLSPSTFAILNNGSQVFTACAADLNAHSMMAGSTFEIIVTGSGTLTGGGSFTLPEILSGPYCRSFVFADSTDDASPATPVTIELKATLVLPGGGSLLSNRFFTGTID